MNPENEYGKWWIISGSLESVTAALQSLISVTSSTRDFFAGCFDCRTRAANCFKQRDGVSNGAWFDCDQVPVDYPHCYDNQVSLEFGHEDLYQYPITNIDANHVSRECNGMFAITSPPDRTTELSVKKDVKEQVLDVKKEEKCEENLKDFSAFTTDEEIAKEVLPLKKNPNFGKYQQGFVDPLSFVYKLEQDHFGYRNDFLRSEGEILSPKFRRSKSERNRKRSAIKSPVLGRSHSLSLNNAFDLKDWDDDSLTSLDDDYPSIKVDDIWKPFELEDAFEIYNTAAFQSLDCTSLRTQDTSPQTLFKSSSDKYEEIFPPLLTKLEKNSNEDAEKSQELSNKTHNNSILPKEESKNSIVYDESLENEINENIIIDNENFLEVTKEELKEFIATCIVADDFDIKDIGVKSFNCDKILVYSGKSFNLKLIYDLVSETKCEYLTFYSNSLLFKPNFPLPIIMNRVISAIEFDINCKTYQLSLLEDIEKMKQKMLLFNNANDFGKVPEEILIENITSDEIIKESRQWQNIEKEEKEMKETVSRDIFDELLCKEIGNLAEIFKKKISNLDR